MWDIGVKELADFVKGYIYTQICIYKCVYVYIYIEAKYEKIA